MDLWVVVLSDPLSPLANLYVDPISVLIQFSLLWRLQHKPKVNIFQNSNLTRFQDTITGVSKSKGKYPAIIIMQILKNLITNALSRVNFWTLAGFLVS
jgi:hypothetical protein